MKGFATVSVVAALLCVVMCNVIRKQDVDFDCPKQDNTTIPLFYPDPEDCTGYYECDNKKAVHLSCPPGLEFNAEKSVCDYPDYAGCSVSK